MKQLRLAGGETIHEIAQAMSMSVAPVVKISFRDLGRLFVAEDVPSKPVVEAIVARFGYRVLWD